MAESGASATGPAGSWLDLARESRLAAAELASAGRSRSSISRAYYAVFAWSVHQLHLHGASMPPGRQGPSHSKLRPMIENGPLPLPLRKRLALSRIVGRLYALRLHADYIPSQPIDPLDAREAASLLKVVFESF